jgi:hypothetical protein
LGSIISFCHLGHYSIMRKFNNVPGTLNAHNIFIRSKLLITIITVIFECVGSGETLRSVLYFDSDFSYFT